MAVIPNSSQAPFGAISVFRFVSKIEQSFQALGMWQRARKAEAELSRLTDRELDDIGLVRGDISHVVQDVMKR